MAFRFDDDQRELAAGVGRLLAARATGDYARAVASGDSSWRDLWSQLVELGVIAMAVPADAGGLELGPLELTAVSEVAGRFLVPGPLVATAGEFVPAVMRASGAAAECIADIAEHGHAATLCLVDPSTTAASVSVTGSRITVEQLPIADAGRAEYLGFAIRGEGDTGIIAVLPAAEAEVQPTRSFDEARPLSLVTARDAMASVSRVGDLDHTLAVSFTTAAAELVGMCARMIDLSVEHAREREQFGMKIGAFQAVKHRLVDALLMLERARSLTYRAAVLADAPGETVSDRELSAAAHLAKGAASQAATEVARAAVQVHGGVGITVEHDISLYYLRARQASLLLGDRDYHYAAAARSSS